MVFFVYFSIDPRFFRPNYTAAPSNPIQMIPMSSVGFSQSSSVPMYTQSSNVPQYSQTSNMPMYTQNSSMPLYTHSSNMPGYTQNSNMPGYTQSANMPTMAQSSMSSMAFTPTAVMRQMTAGPETRNPIDQRNPTSSR